MSYTVKQRFIHMAPRKLRFVADLVRGQSADKALAILSVTPRIAAKPITMAVKSALANARKAEATGNFTIATIIVDEGPAMKRRILKSRGRATRMEHRMSHITVTLAEAAPKAAKVKATKKKAEKA